jgi:hypothetical protein
MNPINTLTDWLPAYSCSVTLTIPHKHHISISNSSNSTSYSTHTPTVSLGTQASRQQRYRDVLSTIEQKMNCPSRPGPFQASDSASSDDLIRGPIWKDSLASSSLRLLDKACCRHVRGASHWHRGCFLVVPSFSLPRQPKTYDWAFIRNDGVLTLIIPRTSWDGLCLGCHYRLASSVYPRIFDQEHQ